MFSWLRKFIVTRKEYDELFLCCVRLTDRIEALETRWKATPIGGQMFKQYLGRTYRGKAVLELRPYVYCEDLIGVSISDEDRKAGSPMVGDMIARHPTLGQWLVSAAYFKDNFESVPEEVCTPDA